MAFCFLEHDPDGWTNNPQSVIADSEKQQQHSFTASKNTSENNQTAMQEEKITERC